ncbi:hypothetical protein OUZ56_031054 [Daphnia magna]|uniref:GMPS ATP-PPase domain-containing protein n=1 Tax=Daphnia magna TaxID=35525 RepID=A0ABQ9ZT42_9CRUS|nr:hypothetical protein OUZ56_031054 [Daphnia magna]
MAKEHGLDQPFIPHSSLESWCAQRCSGTFSSVQVTNNVREIYHPHETWSLFWLTDLFPWNPGYLFIRGQHNFKFDICGLQGGFTLEKREQQCNDYIRRTVGCDKIVLMLGNGGVDSAVCAALFHKALLQGDDSSRTQAIYIDNGFLRKDE